MLGKATRLQMTKELLPQTNIQTSRNIIASLVALLTIVAFIFLASWHIDMPGIYYDEITFVNAALGGIGDVFIYHRIHKLPVMIMPYIGALKSYIYYPIFKIFGVSAVTIRLPVILISACSLWLWYEVGKKIFSNKLCPTLLILVLASDPAFIFQSRLDWGPIVIQIFLMTLSIYLFIRMVRENTNRFLLPIFCCLLLGVYNKLNFIWFVTAFTVSACIFYAKSIMQIYQVDRKYFIRSFSIFLVILLVLFVMLILPASKLNIGPSSVGYYVKTLQMYDLYCATMNGAFVYNYVVGKQLLYPSWVTCFSIAIFIAWLPTLFFLKNRSNHILVEITKYILFFLTIFVLIFIQIVITRQSGGPHHIMMLWPLHLVIMILMLYAITATTNIFVWLKSLIIIVPVGVLIATQIMAVTQYEKAFDADGLVAYKWSQKIYSLSDYINKNSTQISYVVSVDWGTGNQVFAFAKNNHDRKRFIDFWPWFVDLNTYETNKLNWFYLTFFSGKEDLVILYAKQYQIMPHVRDNFFWFAKKYLYSYKILKTIDDGAGKPLYEIYLVKG